jgi:hypothetical protein
MDRSSIFQRFLPSIKFVFIENDNKSLVYVFNQTTHAVLYFSFFFECQIFGSLFFLMMLVVLLSLPINVTLSVGSCIVPRENYHMKWMLKFMNRRNELQMQRFNMKGQKF